MEISKEQKKTGADGVWKEFEKSYLSYYNLKNGDRGGEVLLYVALGISALLLLSSILLIFLNEASSKILYGLSFIVMVIIYVTRWILQHFGKRHNADKDNKIQAVEHAMCNIFGEPYKRSNCGTKETYINCIDSIYKDTFRSKFIRIYMIIYKTGIQGIILLSALLPNFLDWTNYGKLKAIVWVVANIFLLFLINDSVVNFVLENSLISFVRNEYKSYIYKCNVKSLNKEL